MHMLLPELPGEVEPRVHTFEDLQKTVKRHHARSEIFPEKIYQYPRSTSIFRTYRFRLSFLC